MNYKNIIFDFGNVIGTYDEEYILSHFCQNPADIAIVKRAVCYNWWTLDAGTADYMESMEFAMTLVPERLKECVQKFFLEWYKYLVPINEIWDLIRELKSKHVPVYILSNAPTLFAEKADYYEITKEFNGIAFSAPLKMFKPHADFYQYLFETWKLSPKECFFIDDRQDNIAAGKALGMDGIVFTGDVAAIRKAIGI